MSAPETDRDPASKNRFRSNHRVDRIKKSRAARYEKLNIKPEKWIQAPEKSLRARRLSSESQWFSVQSPEDVGLHMSYSAWNEGKSQREPRLEIGDKALKMISEAEEYLVASVFLFDNMYADNPDPNFDIVGDLYEAIATQKKKHPELKIALVLDPLHRAYSDRVSEKVQNLLNLGADVFYSDLLTSKASNLLGKVIEPIKEAGRVIDLVSLGALGSTWNYLTSTPIPKAGDLDGNQIDLLTVRNAILIKANHKKLLTVKGSHGWEALVSSANPHNASGPSANSALSVKGNAAKFIYNSIREDIAQSLIATESRPLGWHRKAGFALISEQSDDAYDGFGTTFVNNYFTKHLAYADYTEAEAAVGTPRAKFLTEEMIKAKIVSLMNDVVPGDEVRLQMFYLSDPVIVNALIKAAQTKKDDGKPIQLLLDANKDAFNSIKDGSPNRQVAHFLINGNAAVSAYAEKHFSSSELSHFVNYVSDECPNCFQVRWSATHGEQNHAKIISITGKDKNQIFTGSCNWTRKNLGDIGILGKKGPINMESNLLVENVPELNLQFNQLFDMKFQNNEENYLLSHPFETWSPQQSFYHSLGNDLLEDQGLSLAQSFDLADEKFNKANPFEGHRKLLIETGKESGEEFSQEWLDGYMLKWVRGERTGLVGW